MPRRYAAYLVRHWVLADGRERVEVRLLPTGEACRCNSLAEAYTWLQHGHDRPATTGPPAASPGGDPSEPV